VAARNTADDIRAAVLDPGAVLRDGYKTVAVTTQDGATLTGILKNEDNFSVQIMMPDGSYRLFMREELRSVAYGRPSLMPGDYSRRLTNDELRDLLAYLDRQRAGTSGAEVWLVKPH